MQVLASEPRSMELQHRPRKLALVLADRVDAEFAQRAGEAAEEGIWRHWPNVNDSAADMSKGEHSLDSHRNLYAKHIFSPMDNAVHVHDKPRPQVSTTTLGSLGR